jgi:hypothetical protein
MRFHVLSDDGGSRCPGHPCTEECSFLCWALAALGAVWVLSSVAASLRPFTGRRQPRRRGGSRGERRRERHRLGGRETQGAAQRSDIPGSGSCKAPQFSCLSVWRLLLCCAPQTALCAPVDGCLRRTIFCWVRGLSKLRVTTVEGIDRDSVSLRGSLRCAVRLRLSRGSVVCRRSELGPLAATAWCRVRGGRRGGRAKRTLWRRLGQPRAVCLQSGRR